MSKIEWLLVDGPAAGQLFQVPEDMHYMQVAQHQPLIGTKLPSFETYAYKRYIAAYGPYQYIIGAIDKDTVSLHEVARLILKRRPTPYKEINYENMF